MLYYMNWLTHDFWTRTGGWEFDHSHGAGTSSPSHWQQVVEQVPKSIGWMVCFLLMTFFPVQKLCVYIYIYQMDCVCQRYHKECSTRTCADDCYNSWKIKWTVFVNVTTLYYRYLFYIEHHALLSIIGLFQIFQMIPVLSAIRAVCFWQCHLVVTAQQEVTSLSSWSPCQSAFTKGLPPWRKGRISCLWIKSVFGKCLHGIWF